MNTQEHIPDKLKIHGKELPFVVPGSYFDDLSGRIQDRLSESGQPKRQTIVRVIRPRLAIAAMFIGFITLGYAGFRLLSDRADALYMSEKELVEAMEYFVYDLDEDMLISAFIESGTVLSEDSPDAQTEELIQYLSEEDIDLNGLMNDY
jgi:hypothetical protein